MHRIHASLDGCPPAPRHGLRKRTETQSRETGQLLLGRLSPLGNYIAYIYICAACLIPWATVFWSRTSLSACTVDYMIYRATRARAPRPRAQRPPLLAALVIRKRLKYEWSMDRWCIHTRYYVCYGSVLYCTLCSGILQLDGRLARSTPDARTALLRYRRAV